MDNKSVDLKIGMTFEQVIAIMGQPDNINNDGAMIYGSTEVRFNKNGGLAYLWENEPGQNDWDD